MIYVVKDGDNVDGIARENGVSLESLLYINQISEPYALAVGQALYWPDESEVLRPPLSVNGYAYPFINRELLEEILPFLSRLSVFSYGFTTEGQLILPLLEDSWMTILARDYQAQSVLVLTPFGEDGRFNNQLISALINNPLAIENLISELLAMMELKDFTWLDIDFEYILAEERDVFSAFVETVTIRMNQAGYQVSVSLAPKTSSEQVGLLYEGKDYGALGTAANKAFLMTYEWGYTYGPPMAVAPINKVRQVVEYALTEIPPEKIEMGVPNYGYDWPLPYERGVTKAITIGNHEAIEIAIRYGARIQYDAVAQSPFFQYQDQGVQHEVWFEDVRSLQAKFDLVKEKGLSGIGYWQIMRRYVANWYLLSNTFDITK